MNSAKLQDKKLTHRIVVFLYIKNEQSEKGMKKIIPFTIA